MGKVDENKKKKKEALFNTAYELFTTKGINATAISDIVEKAGVAKELFIYILKTNMISRINLPLSRLMNYLRKQQKHYGKQTFPGWKNN